MLAGTPIMLSLAGTCEPYLQIFTNIVKSGYTNADMFMEAYYGM